MTTLLRQLAAKTVFIALAAAAGVASSVSADPRWWWDDAQITADGSSKANLDISAATGEGGAGQGGAIFVTWQQWDPSGADWDIWLTATNDGGCSFCEPVPLTENSVDDTRPRIAAAVIAASNTPYSIQVVYESGGNVVLAHEAQSVEAFARDVFCSQLSAAAARIRSASLYTVLNTVPGTARRPDIDLSSQFFTFNHFHVAWEDSSSGTWDVWTDRDLLGDATSYGALGFPMNLTAGPIPSGAALEPVVSGDTMGNAAGEGGVSVAFVDAATGDVLYLRSSDSGATWSGSGAPPILPPVDSPRTISSTSPSPLGGPWLDSSDMGFGAGNPSWEMAGWMRADSFGVEANLQHLVSPGTADVPWMPAGAHACGPSTGVAPRAVTALQGSWGGPSGAWAFWTDSAGASSEIVSRAFTLDPTAPLPIDTTLHPYGAPRPGDSAASGVRALSSCVFDESTFLCTPSRTAGAAAGAASTANFDAAHVVWIDTRTGADEVFYKRSDRQPAVPSVSLTTDCAGVAEGRIHVAIDPVSGCTGSFPFPEKVRRYLVYYGIDPNGPYQNAAAPLVVLPAFPSPLRVDIPGLALATTYHVMVIAEDEARNVAPEDFNPATDNLNTWSQVSITTPAGCAPSLEVSCSVSAESCPDPSHPLEGDMDFGETFALTLSVRNTGTLAATNVEADLSATNASVDAPAAGAIRIASVPANGSVTASATITIDPAGAALGCGDAIDFALRNIRSDGGAWTWPDDSLATCDGVVGGAGGACTNCAPGPNVIVTSCALLADDCATGAGGANGVPDPGELVRMSIVFENIGSVDAVDFVSTATLQWGGSGVSGFGLIGPVTIPAGGTFAHALAVDVSDSCGDAVDVDLSGLSSDSGAHRFPDVPVACDRVIGANPRQGGVVQELTTFLTIPDDGSTEAMPLPLWITEPRRVDAAHVWVSGNMPAPANMILSLIPPGGGSADVSAAWNAGAPGLDITALVNGPTGGPGPYSLRLRDSSPGGGDGNAWQYRIARVDTAADCVPCEPCSPLLAGGPATALPEGQCALRVNWPPTTGTGAITYDLHRDGALLAAGLSVTTYLDAVAWGAAHSYDVESRDACPSNGSVMSGSSPIVSPGDPVAPVFAIAPTATYAGAVNGDCAVIVDAGVRAICAPTTLFEVLRGGLPVMASATNPFPASVPVPADGSHVMSVRVTDAAGNVSSADAPAVIVDNCNPPVTCLQRVGVADVAAYRATRPAGYFLVPPGPGDVHVADPAPTCPFASGDREIGVVGDGVSVTFYDLNRGSTDLRLVKDVAGAARDVVFTFTP